MIIYPFIYTKVPADASPWGKAGFHTVFYPTSRLGRADVARLETHIHIPDERGFQHKQTVFFHCLGDESHLVVIDVRALPEDRDQHGRTGIVLGQGFLFPPSLWQAVASPLMLLALVTDTFFSDRQAMLASPRVNRETGDISPIVVKPAQLAVSPKALPPLRSPFDRRLAVLLNRWARSPEPPFRLLIEGKPAEVGGALDRLAAYVPNALKPRLGWDPALDGGRLGTFPLQIAGFSQQAPLGGNPLRVCLASQTIDEDPEGAISIPPESPYEGWLARCPEEVTAIDQREQAYRLAGFLDNRMTTTARDLEGLDCFVSSNAELIGQRFTARCRAKLGGALTRCLSEATTLPTKLELLLGDLSPRQLAPLVENAVLARELTSGDIQPQALTPLVEAGTALMPLMHRVWAGKVLSHNDLRNLPSQTRGNFLRYLLATKGSSPWLVDLLRDDEELFDACLFSPRSAAVVREMVSNALASTQKLRAIASLLGQEAIAQGAGYEALQGQVDVFALLNTSLAHDRLDTRTIARLVDWAQRQSCPQRCPPYVRAYLYPLAGIPTELLKEERLQNRLLDCLVMHHGVSNKRLIELGFPAQTIKRYAQAATNCARAKRLWRKARRLVALVQRELRLQRPIS